MEIKYHLNIQFMNKSLYNKFIVSLNLRLLQTNTMNNTERKKYLIFLAIGHFSNFEIRFIFLECYVSRDIEAGGRRWIVLVAHGVASSGLSGNKLIEMSQTISND
jgi:hypothetical protein